MYTQEEIILKAKEVHGDKYDYSRVAYNKLTDKVEIICPVHGVFKQSFHQHINKKQGCPKCGVEKRSTERNYTTESFIAKAREKHGDKYDYSKVTYKDSQTKVCIICPEHGEFWQRPDMHLNGRGCKKCALEYTANINRVDKENFIERSNNIHNLKYDYSHVDYTSTDKKVCIICPIHGKFWQAPHVHLMGKGCPKCGMIESLMEDEIYEYITSKVKSKVQRHNRKILNRKELDIYIPDMKIAFEMDGLKWHSEKYKESTYHSNKTNECINKGIRLIHIFEDEWNKKKDICKSRIDNILGITETKVYARKCEILEVEYQVSKDFLDKNHIQGNVLSKYRYGLYYDGELVSLMTFGGLRKNLGNKGSEGSYEMLRFCNKIGTTVIGGAGKLLFHFIKCHIPKEIISYADLRWSNGNLYEKLGFTLSHKSQPNYYYIVNNRRKNRFEYRKSELVAKYGCPKEMTEHEFCLSKGWYRIYDCGTNVYKMIF